MACQPRVSRGSTAGVYGDDAVGLRTRTRSVEPVPAEVNYEQDVATRLIVLAVICVPSTMPTTVT